jgi:hypothetical protein
VTLGTRHCFTELANETEMREGDHGRSANHTPGVGARTFGPNRSGIFFLRAGVSSVREGFPLPATAEARSEGEGSKNAQAHDPRVGPHTTASFEDGHRRTR